MSGIGAHCARKPRHRVALVVNEPQAMFELSCVTEVFGVTRPGLEEHYELVVCAERPGPVRTLAGYDMAVRHDLAALRTAGTIVVPGWLPIGAPVPPPVLRALRDAHGRGARIVAVCSGAFVLAQAGLLDGRRAATHWRFADELAASFPEVAVDADVLYVDHGDVSTSAGSGAGLDLCLHLLRADHGAAYAAQVARHMVLPPHREGGQLQYAARPVPGHVHGSLAPLTAWTAERLGEPLTLDDLAAQAQVSARTLARRFADQLGTTPGQWLLAQRVHAARALLEESDLPVETIAQRVGFSSATNLRRRFRQAVGVTPAGYRRTFRSSRG